jgi:hypothetical protein
LETSNRARSNEWTYRAVQGWYGLGEANRQRLFDARLQIWVQSMSGAPTTRPSDPIIDLNANIRCWKRENLVRQRDCGWEGEYLVCEVTIGSDIRNIRGLICISRGAYRLLPSDPARRTKFVQSRVRSYICGLRPDQPFVFVLRRVGPFLVNWA